jgi:hypothetical protein
MLWWTALHTTKLIGQDTSAYSPKYSRQRHHRFMAAPCAEPWTVENTRDWMDKTLTSTHDLSVWSSSSLGRWHPRSSVLLVLTRHSSLILNERWTCVINLFMFFLLCYDLTTILRSRALHRVLSSAIQYAWCSYMLSRLYRKVKTFRSNLLTYMVLLPSYWGGGGFQLKSSKVLKSLPSFMVRINGMVEIQARNEMGQNDRIGQSTRL